MATNQTKPALPNSVAQEENVVVCLNFSNEPSHFSDFRKGLLEQFATTTTITLKEDELITKFDNKYYTADIKFLFHFVVIDRKVSASDIDSDRTNGDLAILVSTAQALVIIIDDNENNWNKMRDIWNDTISGDCSSDVKLICVYEDANISPEENHNLLWSIKEHFEYIPMGVQETDSDDEESDFKEKFGVARVVEALQTHVWADIDMKGNSPPKPTANKCIFDNSLSDGHDIINVKSEDRIDSLLDEMDLGGVVNGDDPECESFEKLFTNLMEMKKKADTLVGEERKDFAEKVATLFRNALPDTDDD